MGRLCLWGDTNLRVAEATELGALADAVGGVWGEHRGVVERVRGGGRGGTTGCGSRGFGVWGERRGRPAVGSLGGDNEHRTSPLKIASSQ